MLALSSVGLSQESESVVYVGELGGLAYLPLVVFVGSFQDGLPHILHQRLIGIGCVHQLGSYPGFYDFPVSVYSVIYVPGAFSQGVVGLLDSDYSLIGFVDRVAAQLRELPQIYFRLFLLSCQGSDPDRGICQLNCLFRQSRSISDLEQVPWGFQAEHVEVGGSQHFSVSLVLVEKVSAVDS